MIHLEAEINPTGATAERRWESLVAQLRVQNTQLRVITRDLYRLVEELKQRIEEKEK